MYRPVKCFSIKGQSVHVYYPKFFWRTVICGISSGAHSPMDNGSACFDMGGCWPDPSQVVTDRQQQCLCLNLHTESNWRGRSSGREPRQMQVSFLHVHTAFWPQVGCGLALGSCQPPLILFVFQATFLKQREKHWSWGDGCITGRKAQRPVFYTGKLGVWLWWHMGRQTGRGEMYLPSLHLPAVITDSYWGANRRAGGEL